MSAKVSPYTYAARVVRVIDGDTLVADVDLGFQMWVHAQSFRLLGINAREHTQPGGREAAAHLSATLAPDTVVRLTSVKPDKFGGRYDALITLPDGSDLATVLISTGWAAAWDGSGTKPLPPWPRETAP
jgi:endonuclease YncB( thermonuclease family)